MLNKNKDKDGRAKLHYSIFLKSSFVFNLILVTSNNVGNVLDISKDWLLVTILIFND